MQSFWKTDFFAFGHACGVRVQKVQKVQRVQRGKVLRIDRPLAGGFVSLTAFQAEGCGIARRAMSMKSALRDLAFCIIWHEKHSGASLWVAEELDSFVDFPAPRERILTALMEG